MTNILEKTADLELAMAEFYKTAREVFQEDLTFWNCLADAEVLHADYIGKRMDIEYRTLVSEIARQTESHKNLILRKIEEIA